MDGAYMCVTGKTEVMVPCLRRERGEKWRKENKTITKCSFPRNFFHSFHFSLPVFRGSNEPQWSGKRSRDNGVISPIRKRKKEEKKAEWRIVGRLCHISALAFCPPAFHLIINPGPPEPAVQIGSSLICVPGGNQPLEQIGLRPSQHHLESWTWLLIFCCIVTLSSPLLPP